MADSQEILNQVRFFKAYFEEECRLNLVKAMVDSAGTVLDIGVLNQNDQEKYRLWIKKMVLTFIPDQEEKYDMIYDSRLKRKQGKSEK
jgi:hypothetical protein